VRRDEGKEESTMTMTKRNWIVAVLGLVLAGSGLGPALAHGDAKPRHGGTVQVANDLVFELVAQPGGAALYIDDHGKPMPLAGVSGRLTVLNGSDKTEADLAPAGDRLEAKGVKLASGAKVVAALRTAAQKAITVRFTVK
jgi:hypothetical protein